MLCTVHSLLRWGACSQNAYSQRSVGRGARPPPPLWTVALALALAFTIAELPATCDARSIAIADSATTFPYLRTVDHPDVVLEWDNGDMISQTSGCELLRITRRGVRCIEGDFHLLTNWQAAFPETSVECLASASALCQTPTRHFFPTGDVYTHEPNSSLCTNGQGRLLVGENHTAARDDFSLCDIVDRNVDVLYDPVARTVHVRDLANTNWLYTTTSLLILANVILVAETLSHGKGTVRHNTIACALLVLACFLMVLRVDDRMHPVVVEEDMYFFVVSFAYVLLNCAYWVWRDVCSSLALCAEQSVPPSHGHTQFDAINGMLGAVHLATCVLYGSPDNVYAPGFFFVFLLRTLQKIVDAHLYPQDWTSPLGNSLLALDVLYTITQVEFGLIPHYAKTADSMFFAASAFLVAEAIAMHAMLRAKQQEKKT